MKAGAAAAAAAALLAGAGCLSRPAFVPKTYSIDAPAQARTVDDPSAPVLEVRPVEVAAGLDDPELLYRLEGHRLERDPYAVLAAPPGEVLTQAVEGHLRGAGVARSVVEAGSAVPADFLVDVHALDLTGDFSRPDAPAGVVVLQFRVRPAAGGGAPILDRIYESRRPLPRRTAGAVVAAWNDGLAEIVRSFAGDLDRALAERREATRGRSVPSLGTGGSQR
ncbi:MAG TPA: ABC-type transport auxiliary lipoprotein family protein [Anaeromyxobacteraceae bacterium]|nr:ABC-type transport auxiliary lipoprotein family protein [Anaeromyxobacteraceae bacterium]